MLCKFYSWDYNLSNLLYGFLIFKQREEQGRRNGYSRYSYRCTEFKPNFVGFGGIFLLRWSSKDSRRVFKLSFFFQLVAIREVIYDVGEWPDFCQCSRRRLSVNISTARIDKMTLRVNYQQPRCCGVWVCVNIGGGTGRWHPLRASWSWSISNPTWHIFSCTRK